MPTDDDLPVGQGGRAGRSEDSYVLDASAAVSAFTVQGSQAANLLRRADGNFHVPDIFYCETANALRKLAASHKIGPAVAEESMRALERLPVQRWETRNLLRRIGALGDNLSAYDAAYVALAERLGAVLLTADRKMSAAPGLRCVFRIIG